MKKWLIMLFCLLALPGLSRGSVPDELLHEAVMTLTWEDDGGECWVEGHVVLGEENKGDTTEVYMQVYYLNYGFMDGVFTDTGGGSIHPATFVFENTKDGYRLQKVIEPEDGTYYQRSIKAMMPQSCIDKMQKDGTAIHAEMERQMLEQAQAYLDAIGRTEKIQDWRERDLQLDDMLVQASNQVGSLSPPYPLWVTTTERVEDGVRYVYSNEWLPDADATDGFTYVSADGHRHSVNGRTGRQLLTKKRHDMGEVVERVDIRAELYSLSVLFSDAYGSIEYLFDFDGRTYRKPTINRVGDCRVSYPTFEMHAMNLPEAVEEQTPTAVIREESGTRTLVITSQLPDGSIMTTECPKAVRMDCALPEISTFGQSSPSVRLVYEQYADDFTIDENGVWYFSRSYGYNLQDEFLNYDVIYDDANQRNILQMTQVFYADGEEKQFCFPALLMENDFDFAAENFDITKLPQRDGAITKERAQRYVDAYLPEGLTAVSGTMGTKGIGILADDAQGRRWLYVLHSPGSYKQFVATKGNAVPEEAVWDDFHTWGNLNLDLYGPETAYCFIGLRPDGQTWGVTFIGGVDWFDVRENHLLDGQRYVGDHPWRTLDTADLTNLPMTLGDAIARLDTDKVAVVHNPNPKDRLHLRLKPERNAQSLGKYYNGTIVRIHEIKGDWAHVSIAGSDGWMMTEYLAFGEAMNRVESAFPSLAVREEAVREGLIVSEAPNGSISKVLWHMPERLEIIGVVGDDWYHVYSELDGVQGYVRQDCFWEGNG